MRSRAIGLERSLQPVWVRRLGGAWLSAVDARWCMDHTLSRACSVCVCPPRTNPKQQSRLLLLPVVALPAPDASSSWGAWLPMHFGSASDERRVEKLTRKLWEIDEVLVKPKEVSHLITRSFVSSAHLRKLRVMLRLHCCQETRLTHCSRPTFSQLTPMAPTLPMRATSRYSFVMLIWYSQRLSTGTSSRVVDPGLGTLRVTSEGGASTPGPAGLGTQVRELVACPCALLARPFLLIESMRSIRFH